MVFPLLKYFLHENANGYTNTNTNFIFELTKILDAYIFIFQFDLFKDIK